MLTALACLALQQPTLTFDEIERRKHDSFAALKSFKGTYKVVTIPAQGSAIVQEVVYVLGPAGRQIVVLVNDKAVVEMGWTEKETWRVGYGNRKFATTSVQDGLKIKPYEPLKVEKGRVNFVVGENGMRINADPVPQVTGIKDDKVGETTYLKVSASSKNVVTGGELRVDQWFDKGDWVVRRFEITTLQDGVTQISVHGTLVNSDFKAVTPANIGKLPLDQLKGFTKDDGTGGG